MQPLKDYLNESSLSEGIFDRMKNNIKGNIDRMKNNIKSKTNRLSDNMIREVIYKYCANWRNWGVAQPGLKVTKVDKDEKGWYVDTESDKCLSLHVDDSKSFLEYYNKRELSRFTSSSKFVPARLKDDNSTEFMVLQTGPEIYFRWRKHKGVISIYDAAYIESTDGLPEELDVLEFVGCSYKSRKLKVNNKIDVIDYHGEGYFVLSGNVCKDMIVLPGSISSRIFATARLKIHYPETLEEYLSLREKLTGYGEEAFMWDSRSFIY